MPVYTEIVAAMHYFRRTTRKFIRRTLFLFPPLSAPLPPPPDLSFLFFESAMWELFLSCADEGIQGDGKDKRLEKGVPLFNYRLAWFGQ